MSKNKNCSSDKSCGKSCGDAKKCSPDKGFSLVELMVVVAIMAILAVAGLMGFLTAQRRSRDSARKGDVRSITSTIMASATGGNFSFPELFNSDTLPSDPSGNYQYIVVAPPTNLGTAPTAGTQLESGTHDGAFSDQALINFAALGTTRPLVGPKEINGGFVCSIMESGTGGNALFAEDETNPFLAGTDGLEAYGLLLDTAITETTGNVNMFTVTNCTANCNAFCMAY